MEEKLDNEFLHQLFNEAQQQAYYNKVNISKTNVISIFLLLYALVKHHKDRILFLPLFPTDCNIVTFCLAFLPLQVS